jgi:hypothetical protein
MDRGIGTFAGVNTYAANRDKMALYFWPKNSELGLKIMADFLLSFAFTCRGDNIRAIKLSAIGILYGSNENVEGAAVLKKNHFGYDEEISVYVMWT